MSGLLDDEALDSLSAEPNPSPKPSRRLGRFIKGPIPLDWLSIACQLPGKALAMALAIWLQQGFLRRTEDLPLTTKRLKEFCINDRTAKYRALKALEDAKLIQVKRANGKNPLITILNV